MKFVSTQARSNWRSDSHNQPSVLVHPNRSSRPSRRPGTARLLRCPGRASWVQKRPKGGRQLRVSVSDLERHCPTGTGRGRSLCERLIGVLQSRWSAYSIDVHGWWERLPSTGRSPAHASTDSGCHTQIAGIYSHPSAEGSATGSCTLLSVTLATILVFINSYNFNSLNILEALSCLQDDYVVPAYFWAAWK